MTWNQEEKIEMSPEKAEMMELAGKGIKIAITNLNNRFKDVKGKHELNYERNRRHKKKNTKWNFWRWKNTLSEKQIVNKIHHLADSGTSFQAVK